MQCRLLSIYQLHKLRTKLPTSSKCTTYSEDKKQEGGHCYTSKCQRIVFRRARAQTPVRSPRNLLKVESICFRK